MKITNKYIGMLLSIGMMLAIVTGCQDPSDFRKVRNEAITNLQRGGMIDFDDIRQKKVLKGDDPNTGVFEALIYDPNNNAKSYTVGIKVAGNRVQLGEAYTSFPTNLQIKAADIRAAIGVDLEFGEAYTILGEVTTDDGTVFASTSNNVATNASGESTITGGNTDNELLATGSPQALEFPLTVVCGTASPTSAFVGSWKVTSHARSSRVKNIRNSVVNITAGPGPNDFTIVDFWGDGLDFVVTQDPESSDLTSTEQSSYFDNSRGTQIFSQIEAVSGPNSPRAYICGDLIVLNIHHNREDTGGDLSSIESRIRLEKQ
ncbi:hypothetical protein ACV07N_02680 [Roseivirga echinicomitans]